ncbi:T9SS type A sorting domain-containing protein [Chryseobacterium sp. GP-SGM7]|uniref:Ig-like domain-containing protein n=1 Tax=Chryseobacterium sp. GP-SGM7 TaxID=3411323 RepID=UPI003B945CDE
MKQIYNCSFFKRKSSQNYLKSTIAAFTLLFAGQNIVKAQVSTYSFARSSETYTPITGTVLGAATANTSAASLNSDVFPVSLPFGFNFNGTSYNSLNVSTNGFITFGSTAPTTTNTTPISSTAAYEGAVSVWGRDISSFFDVASKSGSISWQTIGTAPNREVVIQWSNFRTNSATTVTSVYSFSFQIRLQETSNIIKLIYDGGSYLVGSTAVSGTGQIGLRGAAATDFNNRLNATTLEYINSTAGTANNSTQAFNTSNAIPGMPSSGLTYTWTPPTCWVPSNLLSGTTTTTTGNISWSSSNSNPSNGYDIYYSTSSTAPTSTTTPSQQSTTTSAILSPLTPSTAYYVWVRSNCGAGNVSVWSLAPIIISTQCQPPAVLSTMGATVCPNQPATLSATADTGATIKWYDSSTGGNAVGTGASFVTPPLTTTTPYYVSASTAGASYVGKTAIESNATTGGGLGSYLEFTALKDFTLNTVDIFPYSATAGTAGTVTIELRTSTGTPITSATVNVIGYNSTATSVPQTVTVNFPVTGGASYRLAASAWTGVTNMYRDASNISYPYTVPGTMSITGAYLGPTNIYYYFFYNWKITSGCESARTMVTATVDSNCLSTAETESKNAIQVYPNPFSDVVNISRADLVKTIKVSDISGKLIKTFDKPESVLRLNDLSQGMYILLLEMKDGSLQSLKVIKK